MMGERAPHRDWMNVHRGDHVMAIDPKIQESASDGATGCSLGAEVPTPNGVETQTTPRLVHRDGVAYLEGCDVAIWRLEMSRRAGSPASALLKVTPGLTPDGLDLAFAYAEQHSEEMDASIRELGLDDVPPEEEEDDEGEFQADLDELFERDAELFRRLAQCSG
jgi:hypothetical protein